MMSLIRINGLLLVSVLLAGCFDIEKQSALTMDVPPVAEKLPLKLDKPRWSRGSYMDKMTKVVYNSSSLKSESGEQISATLSLNYNCYADRLDVKLSWPNMTMVHYSDPFTSAYLMIRFDAANAVNTKVSSNDRGTYFDIVQLSNTGNWIEQGLTSAAIMKVQAIHINQSQLQIRKFKLAGINDEIDYLIQSCPLGHIKRSPSLKRPLKK